ncbi:MAG: hypothetical protein EPN97_05255 [Alphaproteobacteria bacterium]|nr:MAG: hypothetical protein EPN97_05255 [Alphaproteobacteria bacterium]
MNPPPVMKTFEITYALPDNLVEENDLSKSLGFHRFMRHARDCHKNLLEFLIQNALLHEVGGSTLIANERKTLLECSDSVADRVRALPFVEKTEERPDIVPQQRTETRHRSPATNR